MNENEVEEDEPWIQTATCSDLPLGVTQFSVAIAILCSIDS